MSSDRAAGGLGPAVLVGLSSLDASYRPDEIGTPWVISGPGLGLALAYFQAASSSARTLLSSGVSADTP